MCERHGQERLFLDLNIYCTNIPAFLREQEFVVVQQMVAHVHHAGQKHIQTADWGQDRHILRQLGRTEQTVLFNDALNTFIIT